VGNKDIDAKCKVELKVALCCKDCKEKWDKDPASFLAKVDKLPNAKCPVSGEDAGKDCAGTATVAFCCGNCKGKFEKMTKEEKEKMAAKSNAQLVATKQFEQKACPMSGGALNADTAIEVGGAKVSFCCNNCKGKAEKMSDEEKLETVFGEKAFKTAKFTKVEAKK
jgi:hypothetical protein